MNKKTNPFYKAKILNNNNWFFAGYVTVDTVGTEWFFGDVGISVVTFLSDQNLCM